MPEQYKGIYEKSLEILHAGGDIKRFRIVLSIFRMDINF